MADPIQSRWIRYSLELAVVFLGVWLGLLAENYREGRQERGAERVSLARLARDLAFDDRDMTGNLSRAEAGYEAASWLLERTATDVGEVERDSLARYLSQLQLRSVLVANTSEYMALKGAGRINIIQDVELRQRLTELYESYPLVAGMHETDNAELRRAMEHIAPHVRPVLGDVANVVPEMQLLSSPDEVLSNAGFRLALGEIVFFRNLLQSEYRARLSEVTALRERIATIVGRPASEQ